MILDNERRFYIRIFFPSKPFANWYSKKKGKEETSIILSIQIFVDDQILNVYHCH